MENLNLETKIVFTKETQIPVGIAIDALKIINDTFYKSELQDLNDMRKELYEIPKAIFDATELRMQRERNSAVLLRGTREGSVEIVVIGTGLLIWFLQQTLGETIKDTWLASDLHKKIKNFLLGKRQEKQRVIAIESERALEKKLGAEVEITFNEFPHQNQILIKIWFFHPNGNLFPKPPDEILK